MELIKYDVVIGDYPDEDGYATETLQDPDGEFYLVSDVDKYLAGKILTSTKANHMRIKELEDALCGVVSFIESMWDFDSKDEEHFDELSAVSAYKEKLKKLAENK